MSNIPDFTRNPLFRERIVQSAIDDDAYKIHMMQAAYEKYRDAQVEYVFKCRCGENLYELLPQIKDEINHLEEIRFTDDQIQFLSKKKFLKKFFLNHLRDFRFHPKKQVFYSKDKDGQLEIRIRGSWSEVILYEIHILSIVSEVRNRTRFPNASIDQLQKVLFEKCEYLESEIKKRGLEEHFFFLDFGTRRRFSYNAQKIVVKTLSSRFKDNFVGTSNYNFAREFGITAMGTMAHEYLCAHQAIVNPLFSQKKALEVWDDVFRGDLGIALTDSITTDAFLRDFDLSLAKRFDGVRHDSGDPYVWGEKMIEHYKNLGIDPKTKILVFSDSLNFKKALDICEHFKGKIKTSFGIGTFLTNDMGDYVEGDVKYKPLSIVIKLMSYNRHPIAKISDEPNKNMCESPEYLSYLKYIFDVKSA